MKTSDEGIALITRFEGFSPTVYDDAAGLPTIGYGHLIKQGERFDGAIDEAAACVLLKADVVTAEQAVSRLISVALTQPQFDALVSFTYNLGAGVLQRSTMRQKLNRCEYNAVPMEMQRFVYAGGRKLKGLELRRNAEAALFSSDDMLKMHG